MRWKSRWAGFPGLAVAGWQQQPSGRKAQSALTLLLRSRFGSITGSMVGGSTGTNLWGSLTQVARIAVVDAGVGPASTAAAAAPAEVE